MTNTTTHSLTPMEIDVHRVYAQRTDGAKDFIAEGIGVAESSEDFAAMGESLQDWRAALDELITYKATAAQVSPDFAHLCDREYVDFIDTRRDVIECAFEHLAETELRDLERGGVR